MEVVPLINLNAYVVELADVDNRLLSSIVLSGQKPVSGTFMVDNHHTYFEDTVLPDCPEVNNLCSLISQAVGDVLGSDYAVESIWGLVLNRGESVMMHSHKSNSHLHPSEYYSIAYYPSVPDGSAELIFSMTHCNVIEQAVSIKPREGMLVIFNSYIPHMTSRHMSSEPRVVISANLSPVTPNKEIVPDWTPYALRNQANE